MKVEEKNNAILLRKKGRSLNEIVEEIGVSKASVSLWVRDIILTEKHKTRISLRGRSFASIEKRRINRIANRKLKDLLVINEAKSLVEKIDKKDLMMLGIALYMGEGGKTNRGTVRVASSDPVIIKIMIRFFKEIMGTSQEKLRGHIHAYENADINKIENYWSLETKIPRSQFYKTYCKPSIASKQKRKTTPNGTFELNVHDTKLYLTIMALIEKIKELTIS